MAVENDSLRPPRGWRDVYELVEASEDRIHAVLRDMREENKSEHDEMRRDIRALQDYNLAQIAQREGEKRVLGIARSTVALGVSLASGLGALFALFAR